MKITDRWCPFARLSVTDQSQFDHAANRFDLRDISALDNAKRCNCIASACAVFVSTDHRTNDPDVGHCGLVTR